MLVVPAATASLLSKRLGHIILLTLLIAAVCAPMGHYMATVAGPALAGKWLGEDIAALSTAGMMALASGVLLFLAILFNFFRYHPLVTGPKARKGSALFASATQENEKILKD